MSFRYYRDLKPVFTDRRDWTLPTVLRHWARRQPEAEWLYTPEENASFTYGQMLATAEDVARHLLAAGAEKGDRVVVVAANSSRFVHTWFGCSFAGQVFVPINTAYTGEFLAHQVRTVGPRFAVVDDVFAERFVQIERDARTIERFWVIDTGRAQEALSALTAAGWDARPWDELRTGGDATLPTVEPSDLAAVLFTSGTTGPSKGVAMPHAQMMFFAEECVSLVRLTREDTWFAATPMFHGNALYMAAYPTLVVGGRYAMRSKFSASRWIDHIRDARATVTNFLGVMMDFVWKAPPKPYDRDNDLRVVFAAPTAPSLIEPMKERFGIEAFVEVFGLTETSAPILSPYGEERPAGAAGLLADEWFDVDLVDPETDEPVPVGEVGELVVRPKVPYVCSYGYYNMPDKTVEAWRNLWFHTGDALRRDADGWFYFVDRFKDALRRRGENISSYEVESALLGHPRVAEAAVVAVPADSEAGEDEVMAVIVADGEVTADEIWSWCDEKLPAFARPRFLRFLDQLPKTPSQKVQKARLRALGRAGAYDREQLASRAGETR